MTVSSLSPLLFASDLESSAGSSSTSRYLPSLAPNHDPSFVHLLVDVPSGVNRDGCESAIAQWLRRGHTESNNENDGRDDGTPLVLVPLASLFKDDTEVNDHEL